MNQKPKHKTTHQSEPTDPVHQGTPGAPNVDHNKHGKVPDPRDDQSHPKL